MAAGNRRNQRERVAVTARVSARIAEVEDFVAFTHLREQER
jgi:hypothetical protein